MAELRSELPGRQHNHLLQIEPEEVVFTSVRLNQVYSQCVRIINPLSCPLNIQLTCGNPDRITATPNNLKLKSQEEALIEIRLLLRHPVSRTANKYREKSGERAYREIIHIRSAHFQQKFFVLYTCWGSNPVLCRKSTGFIKETPLHTEASCNDFVNASESSNSASSGAMIDVQTQKIHELQTNLENLQIEKSHTEKVLSDFRFEFEFLSKKANAFDELQKMLSEEEQPVAAMVDILLHYEREKTEYKNQKILLVLESKDNEIEQLKSEISSKINSESAHIKEIESLKTNLMESLKEITILKEKLQAAEETIALKEFDFANQSEAFETLKKENCISKSDFEFKMSSLQKEKKELENRLKIAEANISGTEKFEQSNKRYQEELETLRQQLFQITSQHRLETSNSKEVIEKLKSDLAELKSTKENNVCLKKCLLDVQNEIQSYSEKLDINKKELVNKVQLLSEKDCKIEELQNQINIEKARCCDLNVHRLESENANAKEEIQNLQDSVDHLQKLLSNMQSCFLNSQLELRRYSNKKSSLVPDATLDSESKVLKAIVTVYERLWKKKPISPDLKTIIARVHEKLDILDCQLATIYAKNDILEAEKQSIKTKNIRISAAMQRQYECVKAEVRFLKLKMVGLDGSITGTSKEESLNNQSNDFRNNFNDQTEDEPNNHDLVSKLQKDVEKIQHLTKKWLPKRERKSSSDFSDDESCCCQNANLMQEHDKLKFEKESLLAKLSCLENELELERKYALQAENLIADMRDEWCHAKLHIQEKEVKSDITDCSICHELECQLKDAKEQIANLLEILPQKAFLHENVQCSDQTVEECENRIMQLQSELEQAKAHASILVQTLEGLQYAESKEALQQKNALIMTTAAQLSTAKAIECRLETQLKKTSDRLSRTEEISSETQSALQKQKDINFSLLSELKQCIDQKSILHQQLHSERILNFQNKEKIASLSLYPSKLSIANGIIASLRKKVSQQRQQVSDFLAFEDVKSELQKTTCSDCRSFCGEHISIQITELAAKLQQFVLKHQNPETTPDNRCNMFIDIVTGSFRDFFLSNHENAKRIRILEHQHQRDCKKISNLNRNLETLRFENEMISTLLNSSEKSTLKSNSQQLSLLTCSSRSCSEDILALLKNRIKDLNSERDRLQSMLHIERVNREAEVRSLIFRHEEEMSRKFQLEMLNSQKDLQSSASERTEQIQLDKSEKFNDFKVVQTQFVNRLDALMECNRCLSLSVDRYKGLLKNFEINLEKQHLDFKQIDTENDQSLDTKCGSQGHLEPPTASQENESNLFQSSKESVCQRVGREISKQKEPSHGEISLAERINQSIQVNYPRDTQINCGTERGSQTDNESYEMDVPSKNTALSHFPHSTYSNSEAKRLSSSCDQVSVVKEIVQRFRTNINLLLETTFNCSKDLNHTSNIKQNAKAKSQMLKVISDWKYLEPKICDLCNERSKFAVGVEMLRKQLKDLQAVKNRDGFIQKEMKPELEDMKPHTVDKTQKFDQTVQTEDLLFSSTTTQTEQISCSAVSVASSLGQTSIAIQTQTTQTDNDYKNPSSSNHAEIQDLCVNSSVEAIDKGIQVNEDKKSRLLQKKCHSIKLELEKARNEVQSLNQEISFLRMELEHTKNKCIEEKNLLASHFKQELEHIRQTEIQEATTVLEARVCQLESQLKEEVSLHTAQIETLLQELERIKRDREQVARHYEDQLVELRKEKSISSRSVRLLDPNCHSNSSVPPHSRDYANTCSGCAEMEAIQKQLEMTRDQLSLANSKCRELRHDLHLAMSENRTLQENDLINARSQSPSVSSVEHDNAIAKLESKLQQCRAQIKSLSVMANASACASKEISELKLKLGTMQQNINEKEKRIKTLSASIVCRDKVIEDLNSRVQSFNEDDTESKENADKLQEKLDRLTASLTSKQTLVKDLQQKLKCKEADCERKDLQLESFRLRKSMLLKKEALLVETQKDLNNSVSLQKQLESEVQKLKDHLRQSKKEFGQLEKEITSIKSEKVNLQKVLKDICQYLLSYICRLQAQCDFAFSQTKAIDQLSIELNVDPKTLATTLPEFTLLDLQDLLSNTSPKNVPSQSFDSKIGQLMENVQNTEVIFSKLKAWIGEIVDLECKRSLNKPIL